MEHNFIYKQKNIEVVREYKYLGFIFTCSGSTNTGTHIFLFFLFVHFVQGR